MSRPLGLRNVTGACFTVVKIKKQLHPPIGQCPDIRPPRWATSREKKGEGKRMVRSDRITEEEAAEEEEQEEDS